ncbi:MAG: hypothetical protein QXV35_05250 [Archaeoglobaceae archaeon]
MKMENNWEEYIKDLSERILDSLDYWCWNISGDTLLDCYCAHADLEPYELAIEFLGESSYKVTEEDLELLRIMPDQYYNKLKQLLHEKINETIEKIKKEFDYSEEEI